ncbi:histidine kinase [Cryobacterium glucosi]|uniref:histidine kinase n=2 Tax=Cryobacterium glucosi TaxID=1259175 RepID=A0ABY2IQ78_9MICO|nr:histidine kinase [Cryobacterium glucosi]
MTMSASPRELAAYRPRWYRNPRTLDLAAVAVTLVAAATEFSVPLANGTSLFGYLPLTVSLLGVLVSRRYPWTGIVIVTLTPLLAATVAWDPLITWNIAVFTAFSVTLRALPGVWVGLLVGPTLYFAAVMYNGIGFGSPTAFTAFAFGFMAAAAGSAVRSHDRYRNELEQRTLDALAARDTEANGRVTEERLRIARDLHDVIGHEVAVLGIHLGVAEVNLPSDAAVARESLHSARTSVQSVLLETQRILHVLRSDTTEGRDSGVGLRPAPDFSGIPDLIESCRNAGVDVRADLTQAPAALDPEVSTAAFRIVQEALTNSQRHGSGPVTLSTTLSRAVLTITVSNPKTVRTAKIASPARTGADLAPRRGHGLVGMRERAASAGGKLVVEDRDDLFHVTATLRVDGGRIR